MTYWIKPLTARPEPGTVTHWSWADHDGWHTATSPPVCDPVPTGQVWAWGNGTWAQWREDPTHDRVAGCLMTKAAEAPGPGWVKAVVSPSAGEQGKGPRVRAGEDTIRTHRAGEDGYSPERLHGKPATVLEVLSPTRVSLFEVSL